MLSFLFKLVKNYQQEHGYLPNVLYMNPMHYQKLREDLPEIRDYEQLTRFLRLEIILSAEAMHPHVAWMNLTRRYSAANH